MKQGTPDSMTYSFLFSLIRLWQGRKHKLEIDDRLLRQVKPPYILLANHESYDDFYYVSVLSHPRRPCILANEYYCTRPVLKNIAGRIGIIPKKLFTKDVTTGIRILRVIRQGNPLIIFPEGRLSPDGRSNPIVESGARLYRAAGIDLVLTRIDGAYLSHPKWRKKTYRSPVRISVVRILRAEELRTMRDNEIDQVIRDTLYHDISESRDVIYPWKDKAAGLETLLYRCASCGELYQTFGTGNQFVCRSCGRRLHLDETYHFTEAPFSIPAYFDQIRAMESAELDRLSLTAPVRTKIFGANGGPVRREKGSCTLTPSCFSYRSDQISFSIPTEDLPAMAFSCAKEFELYYRDELYYFYPTEEPNQVTRWSLAVDLLAEKRRAGASLKRMETSDEKE